jgi:hypothetical protein
MLVFGVWSESVVFVVSRTPRAKSQPRRSRAVRPYHRRGGGALIVEGQASRVLDEETLERASATFERLHDWQTTIAGDELDAEYGAPTSVSPFRRRQASCPGMPAITARAKLDPSASTA